MKNKTTFKPIVLTLCMLFVGLQLMVAQTRSISGTVTSSADNGPIPGVSIVEKGTVNGTITNIDGVYSLQVAENATLVFSFVGMTAREIVLQGQSVVNVELTEDRVQVGEVVVTALGIKRKSKSLTYSTQAIGGDDLTTARDVNMINSLAGKSAGVLVSKSSSGLGGSSKVLIRGSRRVITNPYMLSMVFQCLTQLLSSQLLQ